MSGKVRDWFLVSDLIEMFQGDWLDRAIGGLLVVLVLALVGVLVWIGFTIADTWRTPTIEADAEVVGVYYRRAHYQLTHVGKMVVPIYQPESWSVWVLIDGDKVSGSFSRELVRTGDRCRVGYSIGRLSGDKSLDWLRGTR